mmetsp:Transcript_35141/g.100063  ORF Transcript_35141/g.100063 Transcript_35141/m.100063 type:complete len:207 (+) Transcript_35141:60-680(+)
MAALTAPRRQRLLLGAAIATTASAAAVVIALRRRQGGGASKDAEAPKVLVAMRGDEDGDTLMMAVEEGEEEDGEGVDPTVVQSEIRRLTIGAAALRAERVVEGAAASEVQALAAELERVAEELKADLDSDFAKRWRIARGHPLRVLLERVEVLVRGDLGVDYVERVASARRAVDWLQNDELWKEDLPLSGRQLMNLRMRKGSRRGG